MSKRVLSGSSSEDEHVGLLGGSGVESRRARFEVSQIGDGSFSGSGAKKVSISTKFLTIFSFSAVLILGFVGVYIGSNSVFFKLGAGENHNRKQKATQVFLAAGVYFAIGLYNGLKWKSGTSPSKTIVRKNGRIN
jgi:hypothetical protein|tara:strand:+ start:302 stop:706 length:405 start_codon:yes stop_codon:yes gene_type:complete